MNNISTFLYIADVLYAQAAYLRFLLILLPIAYLILRFFQKIRVDYIDCYDKKELQDLRDAENLRPFIASYLPFTISLVGIFLLNLVPSQQTFYLIVASELGEMVVTTPEAEEIMDDVLEIVKSKLQSLKTEMGVKQ